MTRLLTTASLTVLLFVYPAWAQSESSDPYDLTTASPQQNARTGRVSARAPGNWIKAAIARHNEFIGLRVNGPRFGNAAADNQPDHANTGGSTSSGGFGSLFDLAGSLAGGLDSFGGLGNLGDLFGGGTSVDTGGPSASGGSQYTIEDLLAIRDAYADLEGANKTINNKTTNESTSTQTRYGRTFGGAIARLPKAEERFQDIESTEERSFKARLLESWATTFFGAVTLAFQTDAFVQGLKDLIAPLYLPPVESGQDNGGTDADENGGDSETGDGSGSDADGDSGTSTGGGIEDVTPPGDDAGTDDGGSII
ncbi:MAG: hypothetical protein KAY37_14210 [Phycisphaerae bacterium]|nr:hypothetical protein [Phycisphaerae bacterium]